MKKLENILKEYQKIELFISKYNWERINYPLGKNHWKKFEKNNLGIALNILYAKNE